jgi:sugar lactone lactonase YvrE
MGLTRRSVLGAAAAVAAAGPARAAAPTRLVFLSASAVFSVGLDGSDLRTLHEAPARSGINDGVAFDPASRRVFWTNMGRPSADDGWIASCGLDGADFRVVVPPGATFTPKQLAIADGRLYWSDREGMAVMRANLDGSGVETLVRAGEGDAHRRDPARWCVGVAVDEARRTLWWTQKGGDDAGEGSIRRTRLDAPGRGTEVVFDQLPEPIDLAIDPVGRRLYWTDRGDNTVSRCRLDYARPQREVLVRGLREAIGIAVDPAADRMFYTSLAGDVGSARLDGSGARTLLTGRGMLTGCALV